MVGGEGSESTVPWLRAAYRISFLLGVALYVLCFAAGTAHVLRKEGRLPSLSDSALRHARELMERGDIPGATAQYRMAARIDRSNYEIPRELAESLRKLGDTSGEIDQRQREVELRAGDPATHRRLAMAFYGNRRFEEAVREFREALRLDPTDVRALTGLGEALLDLDRLPEAERAFQEALRLSPENAGAHNSLGIVYALEGRRAEAIARFEEAVRLNPVSEFRQNLERARAERATKP